MTASVNDTGRSVDHLFANQETAPFAPMIYVAWADGELTDDEITSIHERTQCQDCLDDASRAEIARWLDPQAPPTATELLRMLRHLREQSQTMGHDARRSLADLGAALSPEGADEDTQRALSEIENTLGVSSSEAVEQLLAVHGEPSKEPKSWRELEAAAAFDVDAMRLLLDGEQAHTRERVRDMLRAPVFAYDYELSKEDQRELVLKWLQVISDTGITRTAYPSVLGESEDMSEFMALFETLAYFDISLVIKFGVQLGLFGGSIYFLGTKKHHDAYLADAASLALPGCFAMTELGHGSNVRGLETTATFDPETREWIIHTPTELGRKEWIGNAAAHAHMATVFAQLIVDGDSYGVHALLVPIRSADGDTLPGVYIDDCGHKLGLNGVDNGRLWFDSVRVPYDNLLDRYASVDAEGTYQSPIPSEGKRFFTMLGTLVGGRVSIAAASLSASKSALTIATRYGAHRRQFGPSGKAEIPILDFLTHQRRLMPLIAKAYALNYGIRYLNQRYLDRSERDEREVEALAAGFKSYASWFAVDAIQTSRECCGGQGYLSVNRFANLKADTDIFTTFEGDNTVLMQLLAKSLLSEYAQNFQDLNFFSTLRFLRAQASTKLAEFDPVTSRRAEPEHLRDLTYWVGTFRHRESMLTSSVAARFKRRTDAGKDSFDAMLEVQDHLLSTAHAHMQRVLLEQFVAGIEATQSPAERAQLTTLAQLFALTHVSEDMGWFMENSLVEAPKAKAIRTELNLLCGEVRAQAVHLVDAFGIPDELLAAPIAKSTIVPSDLDTHTD